MRWKQCLAVVLVLCVLSGCGSSGDPTQQALEFRTALMEKTGCTFTAQVTASQQETVYEFTVQCRYSGGMAQLTVTEPSSIAGIEAAVEENGATLTFDGATLDLGTLANGLLSPLAAGWLLAECWLSGYIAYAGADGTQRRVTYLRGYNREELTVDTWFADQIPTYAEVTWDGSRCLSVVITDFQMI